MSLDIKISTFENLYSLNQAVEENFVKLLKAFADIINDLIRAKAGFNVSKSTPDSAIRQELHTLIENLLNDPKEEHALPLFERFQGLEVMSGAHKDKGKIKEIFERMRTVLENFYREVTSEIDQEPSPSPIF